MIEMEYEKDCCIRGQGTISTKLFGLQLWEKSWSVLESLAMRKICVVKGGIIIGYLPKKMSLVCSLFIRKGGNIHCIVTGKRRYSTDLAQGGLDIPWRLIFKGKQDQIKKLQRSLKLAIDVHIV